MCASKVRPAREWDRPPVEPRACGENLLNRRNQTAQTMCRLSKRKRSERNCIASSCTGASSCARAYGREYGAGERRGGATCTIPTALHRHGQLHCIVMHRRIIVRASVRTGGRAYGACERRGGEAPCTIPPTALRRHAQAPLPFAGYTCIYVYVRTYAHLVRCKLDPPSQGQHADNTTRITHVHMCICLSRNWQMVAGTLGLGTGSWKLAAGN